MLCEAHGLGHRVVDPYAERDQPRCVVSTKIRMHEPDPGLQHQPSPVVGIGKVDPILRLTGEPDLGQISCKTELQQRAERHIPMHKSIGV